MSALEKDFEALVPEHVETREEYEAKWRQTAPVTAAFFKSYPPEILRIDLDAAYYSVDPVQAPGRFVQALPPDVQYKLRQHLNAGASR